MPRADIYYAVSPLPAGRVVRMYLVFRDHLPHAGTIEVVWRQRRSTLYMHDTDLIWAYLPSWDQLVKWAFKRDWRDTFPLAIIDLRAACMDQFEANPLKGRSSVFHRVEYVYAARESYGEFVRNDGSSFPEGPQQGADVGDEAKPDDINIAGANIWAAFENTEPGSMKERLVREKMSRLNRLRGLGK